VTDHDRVTDHDIETATDTDTDTGSDQRIADRIRAAFADEHPSLDLPAVLQRAQAAANTASHESPARRRPARFWLTRILRRRPTASDPAAAASTTTGRRCRPGGAHEPTP
jgi:hypothetical protein